MSGDRRSLSVDRKARLASLLVVAAWISTIGARTVHGESRVVPVIADELLEPPWKVLPFAGP